MRLYHWFNRQPRRWRYGFLAGFNIGTMFWLIVNLIAELVR
jgi:hypothetical protein